MRAEEHLFEATANLSSAMWGEDPYISADDKVELERIRVEIHKIRNMSVSRQEDDELARDRLNLQEKNS